MRMRWQRLPRGALIGPRGAAADSWCHVERGLVASGVALRAGWQAEEPGASATGRVNQLYGRGAWFGEAALVEGLPRPFEYRTLAPSVIGFMAVRDFRAALADCPFFVRYLLNLVSHRAARTLQLLLALKHGSPFGRIACVLAHLCESLDESSAWSPAPAQSERVEVAAGQAELAQACDVSRTLLNSVLAALAAAGFVEVAYGRLTFLRCGAPPGRADACGRGVRCRSPARRHHRPARRWARTGLNRSLARWPNAWSASAWPRRRPPTSRRRAGPRGARPARRSNAVAAARAVWFLAEGVVSHQVRLRKGGAAAVVSLYGAGTLFNQQQALFDLPNAVDTVAVTPVALLGIEVAAYRALIEREPAFLRAMLSVTAHRATRLSEAVAAFKHGAPAFRVAFVLSHFALAFDPSCGFTGRNPARATAEIVLPASLSVLASMANVSRSALGVVLRELSGAGFVGRSARGALRIERRAAWLGLRQRLQAEATLPARASCAELIEVLRLAQG